MGEQVVQFLFLPFIAIFLALVMMINALCTIWLDISASDPITFVFPSLTVATLVAIAIRHFIKPYSERWNRFAKYLLFLVNLIAPMLYIGVIYLLSFRGWQVLGHEPRYMLDDPKHICRDDVTYQMLFSAVSYAQSGSSWLLYSSAGLATHLWRHLTMKEIKWYFVTLIAGWALLVLTDRFSWWLD
jgi:hypothetical protein